MKFYIGWIIIQWSPTKGARHSSQFHNSIVNLRWKLKGLAKYAVNDLINAFFHTNDSYLIDTASTLLKFVLDVPSKLPRMRIVL